jgi:integrase
VLVYRDLSGRQHKQAARTLAEARSLKAVVQADIARGEYRTLGRITFLDYVCEWLPSYSGRTSRGLRNSTRREYAIDLGIDPGTNRPLEPARGAVAFFGKRRLTEIEPRDVKLYVRSLEDRGLAPASVARRFAPLRALFATAVEDGLIRSNPATGVRRIASSRALDEEVVKALTEPELGRLLAAVPDQWRLLIVFMVHTGLRISEVVALRWRDVDVARSRIRIRRAFRNGEFVAPKSRYARREVPISPEMLVALIELRAARDASDGAPVFAAVRGGLLDSANLAARVLKPAARAAGVPWVSFHTLRHTSATLLFRHGANARQVQMWLGHHSPAFTLATYVHLLPEDLPDAGFFDAITSMNTRP